MARIIALVLVVSIAIAVALVATPDVPAPNAVSPAPHAAQSIRTLPVALSAPASVERVSDSDARGIGALLERLLTLDSVGALQDDALVMLAERDLEAALRAAAAISDRSVQDATLQRLAEFAVGIDARAALGGGRVLGDGIRIRYERGVFAAWAAIDPASVLAFLSNDMASIRLDAVDWKPLAQFDARAVLNLANPYSSEYSGFDSIMRAQEAALVVWTARDPQGAAAYTAAIEDWKRREQLAQRVGRVYARSDPEAALRWALSLEPRSTTTPSAVIAEIAARDLDRAAGLLLDESLAWPPNLGGSFLVRLVELEAEAGWDRRLADRLVRTRSERADQYLTLLIMRWDPYEALDWVVANAGARQAAVLTAFHSAVVKEPQFAAYGFNRLPPSLKGDWMVAVGEALGEVAPQEAIGLVATLRGERTYEAALAEVITGIGKTDVRQAARMLESASLAVQATAVPRVASAFARENATEAAAWAKRFDAAAIRESAIDAVALAWGRQSGAEAAAWAASFAEDATREAAIGAVARGWTATDAQGARSWVLSLSRGPNRDAGLRGALTASANNTGAIDESLVAEFSSDAVLQVAVSRLLGGSFAYNHVEAVEGIIDRFLTNEALRERARADHAQARTLRGQPAESEPPALRAPSISAADLLRNAPTRSAGEAQALLGAEAVRTRREAHTVLAVRGYGGDVVKRVADTLTGWNRQRFVLEALERQASFDGYGAFAAAAVLEDPLRYVALPKIGAAWAAHDAIGALAAASGVPDDVRYFYVREVFGAWARVDTEGLLRYLATADISADAIQVVITQLRELVLDHPDTARALTAKLPEVYRGFLN